MARRKRLDEMSTVEQLREVARVNREEAEMTPAWRDRCLAEAEDCEAYADYLERAERGEASGI